jgi:DNA-directed RNA polymerase alpha subunit
MGWTFDGITTDAQRIALRLRESTPPATYRDIARQLGISIEGARAAYRVAQRKRRHLEVPALDAESQHSVLALANWAPDDYDRVTRVANCLMRGGLVTFEQVAAAGADLPLRVPGIGDRSLELIERSLGRLDMTLAPLA